MDRFGYLFFITHFATNKQHHTTAQNTSNQLAQCNFHHVCSCMISVLFSNMLKETRAVYYVGQSFPEVGWYGKTCLFSLWILVVKSAVRIWMCLDCFFPFTHFATNTSSTTQPHKVPATNLRHAIFTMCVLAWVLFCFPIMLKETHAVDYVLKYGTAQYLKVNVASSNWINQMWLYRILATPVVISCS